VIEQPNGARFNDKGSITADPFDPNLVYVTWSRISNSGHGPTWFSRSADGGQSWEPARKLFDDKGSYADFAHQILVLPDGTLANIFHREFWRNDARGVGHYDREIAILRSPDKGVTWEGPIKIADQLSKNDTRQPTAFASDPDTGSSIRTRNDMPDVAVDPNNGNVYVVWEDARFGDFQYPSIALAMSTDGGLTWSEPIQVNQTPTDLHPNNQQALHPSVHVNADGVVAVTYYDFRFNTPEEGAPTDYWLVHADPATALADPLNWASEVRLTDESFILQDTFFLDSPGFRSGYFIGDYEGLASDGSDFLALFIQPGEQEDDHGSVFYRRVKAMGDVAADDALQVAGDAEVQTTVLWYVELEQERPRGNHRHSKPPSAELVSLTVEFAGQTYTGTTDADRVFGTSWIKDLGSGDHYANAVDLVLANYAWDPLMDLEDDSDGDGNPDDLLSP
jgi:hypothetical protein